MNNSVPSFLTADVIFVVQFLSMMLVNILVASWYLVPWLKKVSLKDGLTPLLLLHATRVIGLVFIVSAVTDPGLPGGLAMMAAFGDFSAAILSLIALAMVRKGVRGANVMVVIANIVGLADLLIVSIWGSTMAVSFPNFKLGTAWFIPTFIGPTMMVTHGIMFWLTLFRKKNA
jgi:hypothetical protein